MKRRMVREITGYGKYIVQDGKELGFTHTIKYNDGITADQVIASASVPLNFGYIPLEVERIITLPLATRKIYGTFGMGGIMSNTPLTQVVLPSPILLA